MHYEERPWKEIEKQNKRHGEEEKTSRREQNYTLGSNSLLYFILNQNNTILRRKNYSFMFLIVTIFFY